MELHSWQFLSQAEKQALREEMRDAAAGMDNLLQRKEKVSGRRDTLASGFHALGSVPNP